MQNQWSHFRYPFIVTWLIAFIMVFILAACASPTQAPSPATPTHQPPTSVPATQSIPTTLPSSTRQPAFPLSGTWSGTAKNGDYVMDVTIILQPVCQAGEICGTYDLSLPCSGSFALIGEKSGVYEFHAVNKSASCTGEGKDYLQLLPNGDLQYSSKGPYGETLGELVHSGVAVSTSTAVQKLLVFDDDDGSPDGTSALFYLLLKPNVDVKAAAISYGEAHPQVYIQFIGRMLDHFGFPNITLGTGMDGSLSGNEGFPEWLRQGAGNFWGWPAPNANKTYPTESEADLIISAVKQSPQPVTLFFSGPVTNLALALRKAPEIRSNIAALYMMAGAVYVQGNVHDFYPDSKNTYADWNPYSDPIAYKEVFESGIKMYLVPLDATNQVQIDKSDTAQWRKGGTIANFDADIYDGLMSATGKNKFSIWDLMAAEIMANPDLCPFKPLHLDVVTEATDHFGQLVVVPDKTPNINVCLYPNVTGVKQELIDTFSNSK
jgi:pyrimidine-specific ribonucleoside hydrolase